MASPTTPRTAMRSLFRAAPAFRSKAPRTATRCLHQKATAITASPLQHRPTFRQWHQKIPSSGASLGRRTMFIQTEATPNPDVRYCDLLAPKSSADFPRPLSSIRIKEFYPNPYHRSSSSTSLPALPSRHHIRLRSLQSC